MKSEITNTPVYTIHLTRKELEALVRIHGSIAIRDDKLFIDPGSMKASAAGLDSDFEAKEVRNVSEDFYSALTDLIEEE